MSWAYLNDASLGSPHARGANLRGADLRDTRGVNDNLLAEAESLESATMPDGQKYEAWIKTPEGQDWLKKYKKDLGTESDIVVARQIETHEAC